MKMRPHCFLRPILRPVAVFAIAFGVSSLMLSAQEEDAAPDVDEAVTEAVEVTESDSEEAVEAEDGETAEEAAEAEDGEAAEEAEEEEPVLEGDELEVTSSVEEDLLSNEGLINELLATAITRTGEKQFNEAFSLFDTAKAEIEKCEATPAKAVYLDRLASERKKAQILYGEEILEKCEKDFNKLLLLAETKHTDEIIDNGQKLLKDLICANVVYYLGIPPGIDEEGNYVTPSYDNGDLQVAIANDPTPKKEGKFADRVASMTKTTQEHIDSQKYWDQTSLDAVDPRYNERQREIDLLYRAGEFLYQKDQWDDARDKMEQILVKDPYNERAMTLLEKIYRRLYAIADVRSYNEFLREQAQSDWSWVESIPDVRNIVITGGAEVYEAAGNELYTRLNELMIDHIEFEESDLGSAITLLRARSKDLDPQGEGFNIIIPQAEKYADKLVTLNLDQIPLYEVIRYICKITGLSFRIDETDKIITIGSGSDVSDMVTRYIPIRQATVLRIVGNMRAEGIGDGITQEDVVGAVDAGFANVSPSTIDSDPDSMRVTSIAPETLKTYFVESGIPFEDGSSIAYDARANKLTVVNTPENIRQLEFAIRDMDMQDPLILIESKMVEIKMNDLEELGFDWTLSHTNGEGDHFNFTFTSPSISSGFSDNTLVNNLNLIPNFGPGGSWSLFLTINAIDRTDRAEILSTPKVVTVSGRQAQVQMVRQMYFPEEWTEPEISTSCGSSVSFEPSYPEFGPARDIGTSLTVTPTLQPNNYTIRLELNPSVTDLTGWSDYSYNYVIGEFSSGEEYPMTLKMPEISNREVQTTIKVYDGQTVVIGGILRDTHGQLSDRWPIFADIPLIGRLFTESASEAHKDNLIISVSTRLISGDGIPVRTNTQNGLPDFRR
jgi:general secretion pathway protein D